ncbi:MAG: hypothetical protein IPK60_04815 [Sandaracinaceae bacterium]|nr:hypothetical protein [Sandaracinaceae bacterium]
MKLQSLFDFWKRKKKTPRYVLALLSFLVLLVAVAGTLVWLTKTESGRAVVAARVARVVSERIVGSMTIGTISRISWSDVNVHDVHIKSADGRDVVVARDTHLTIRWWSLLAGDIIVPRARVRSCNVFLRDSGAGFLSLEEALRTPSFGNERPGSSPFELTSLSVSDAHVFVRMSGMPDIQIRRVEAHVHAWLPRRGAKLMFTATQIRGRTMVNAPIPFHLQMRDGRFDYDASKPRRGVADVRGEMSGASARLQAWITVRNDSPHIRSTLHLRNAGGWLQNAPMILQASLAELVDNRFEFSVEMN